MCDCKTQSVILNFNPSFRNGKAYDFTQNFNRQLNIEEDAMVCLYGASLTRKPIVVPNSEAIKIEIAEGLPTYYVDNNNDLVDTNLVNDNPENRILGLQNLDIQVTMPKGEYTRQSFLRELSEIINKKLNASANTTLLQVAYKDFLVANGFPSVDGVRSFLPYNFTNIINEKGVFFGLSLNMSKVSYLLDNSYLKPIVVRRLSADRGFQGDLGVAPSDALGCGMSLEVTLHKMTTDNTRATGNDIIKPVGNPADPSAFEYYIMADSPLYPINNNRLPLNGEDANNFTFFEWEFSFEEISTRTDGITDSSMCCVFTNDFIQAQTWDIAPNTDPAEMIVNPNTNGSTYGIPAGLFGVYERLITDVVDVGGTNEVQVLVSELVVVEHENLSELDWSSYRNSPNLDLVSANDRYERKFIIQNRNGNNVYNQKLKCVIYSVDTGNYIQANPEYLPTRRSQERKYFYQIWGGQSNGGTIEWDLLYDQRNGGDSFIPAPIVEDGSLARMVGTPRPEASVDDARLDVGIKPFLAMRNPLIPSSSDPQNGDFIYNAHGTFAQQLIYRASDDADYPNQPQKINLIGGITDYAFACDGVCKNILGVNAIQDALSGTRGSSTDPYYLEFHDNAKNPNMFGQNQFGYAGYTKLYSDLLSYNIEITSFPIKTFNSTSRPKTFTDTPFINPAGSLRPIIYNVPSLIEDTTDIQNVYVNKGIQPTIQKYISLDNVQPLKLNTLEVKINRAETNEPAEEIIDAKLEIIIKNKK